MEEDKKYLEIENQLLFKKSKGQMIQMYMELLKRIDKAKIELSTLMSRYFYEEDFYIEDTHLDEILKTLDGGNNGITD